jgi:hypothetical protein
MPALAEASVVVRPQELGGRCQFGQCRKARLKINTGWLWRMLL